MEVEWFCRIMGSEVGPLSQSQLVDMVRQQKVNPEDLVKRNNSPWVAAFEVRGLFAAAAKPAKPKPTIPAEPPLPPTSSETVSEAPAAHDSATRVADDRENPPAANRSIAPSSNAADWYCIASGEKQGPLGFSELQALAADGRLRQTDRVWRSSAPKFRKASEIEGLQAG